jgi:SNF2 family DNA or RNA helicase
VYFSSFFTPEAIDRIHRVGQKRDVQIYKYIAQDTVEERILRLQEKKRQMFETTMETKSRDELRQMMVDDLKELFMT